MCLLLFVLLVVVGFGGGRAGVGTGGGGGGGVLHLAGNEFGLSGPNSVHICMSIQYYVSTVTLQKRVFLRICIIKFRGRPVNCEDMLVPIGDDDAREHCCCDACHSSDSLT